MKKIKEILRKLILDQSLLKNFVDSPTTWKLIKILLSKLLVKKSEFLKTPSLVKAKIF